MYVRTYVLLILTYLLRFVIGFDDGSLMSYFVPIPDVGRSWGTNALPLITELEWMNDLEACVCIGGEYKSRSHFGLPAHDLFA